MYVCMQVCMYIHMYVCSLASQTTFCKEGSGLGTSHTAERLSMGSTDLTIGVTVLLSLVYLHVNESMYNMQVHS